MIRTGSIHSVIICSSNSIQTFSRSSYFPHHFRTLNVWHQFAFHAACLLPSTTVSIAPVVSDATFVSQMINAHRLSYLGRVIAWSQIVLHSCRQLSPTVITWILGGGLGRDPRVHGKIDCEWGRLWALGDFALLCAYSGRLQHTLQRGVNNRDV